MKKHPMIFLVILIIHVCYQKNNEDEYLTFFFIVKVKILAMTHVPNQIQIKQKNSIMKTKYLFFTAACLLFVSTTYSQPQRIGKSNTYWELRNDTLFITGKGRMERVLPIPWNNIKKKVKYIYVEEGIQYISQGAFTGCNQLTHINLPQSINSIGINASYKDSNLRHVVFPDNVDSICGFAFYMTGLHDTLKLPSNVYHIDGNSFSLNKITHVNIPYKVDTLYAAFSKTDILSTVVLPAGLRYMVSTFCCDSLLRSIVSLNITPPMFRHSYKPTSSDPYGYLAHTFYNVDCSKCRLIVPTSAVETYKNTPVWQDFLIEGGGLSVGVCFNDKRKGNVEGVENRFYEKGEKVSLKAEPRGQCTFSGWKSPDGKVISTANPLNFTVTQDTMLQACFDGEVSVREAEQSASVGENIILYPNPTGDHFSVQSDAAVKALTLYDLSGRQLLQKENADALDISSLPQGIYLVRIRTEKGVCVKKLVKE